MHVHAVGRCDPSAKDPSGATVAFFSAGGHHKTGTQTHGDHAGDLPTVLALRNGTATLSVVTDRFRIRDLVAADGSAVIVHALRDNQANIPPRYSHPQDATGTTGPDEMTHATGDAGARAACGRVVLRR
jgi:Cu-Zn family superoxide dismutase